MNRKNPKETMSVLDYEKQNQILDRIIFWIENSDMKASIVLSGVGVLFSILLTTEYFTLLTEMLNSFIANINVIGVIFIILIILSFVGMIYGVVRLIRVLNPSINSDFYTDNEIVKDSVIAFTGISKLKTFVEYQDKCKKTSQEDLMNDIQSQIYICSIICNKKFINYKIGSRCLLLGFLLLTLVVIIRTFTV